jgi:SAM-dependent methyltransferase
VADISDDMLALARAKGLETREVDASALPFAAGSFDAATLIMMIHHVPDWRGALAEARRVLVRGGILTAQIFLRENLEGSWVFDYFPRSKEWIWPGHMTAAELAEALPGAELHPYFYDGIDDGSLMALSREPASLLDARRRDATSYFEVMAERDPGELATGVDKLRVDLGAGRRPERERRPARERWGDGTVVVWTSD